MTIWEIDREIDRLVNAVDEETGEVLCDVEALEALSMAREEKVENLALAVKNMTADAKAIKAEEDALAQRRKSIEAKVARAKEYLEYVCAGEGFKSSKVVVSFRPSTSCEVDADFLEWAKADPTRAELYLRYDEPKVNKKALTDVLKIGTVIPFAQLVTRKNITIK